MDIFETFQSDFIVKMNHVIKHLSGDMAKKISKKVEKVHNETRIIHDEFKVADEKISKSMKR